MILNIYKPIGLTPLQAINEFKKNNPEFKNKKMGYAGRLDPLAHGVLLIMVSASTKKGAKYQDLPKKYSFSVLLGINTDTYDSLGVIAGVNNNKKVTKKEVINVLNGFLGKSVQKYPMFSSAAYKGKPLFWWARKGLKNKVKIPEKDIEVYSIKLRSINKIPIDTLEKRITKNINKVNGDFRQEKIISEWKKYFKNTKEKKLTILEIDIVCSSGTYVRSIANTIGGKLKTKAIALDILRTQVGGYKLKDSLAIDKN